MTSQLVCFCLLLSSCAGGLSRSGEGPPEPQSMLVALIKNVDSTIIASGVAVKFHPHPLSDHGRVLDPLNHGPAGALHHEVIRRTRLIITAGADTGSGVQWVGCPGLLLPEGSRSRCPDSTFVVVAFGDPQPIPSTAGRDVAARASVLVQTTLLTKQGYSSEGARYLFERSGGSWRLVERKSLWVID